MLLALLEEGQLRDLCPRPKQAVKRVERRLSSREDGLEAAAEQSRAQQAQQEGEAALCRDLREERGVGAEVGGSAGQ